MLAEKTALKNEVCFFPFALRDEKGTLSCCTGECHLPVVMEVLATRRTYMLLLYLFLNTSLWWKKNWYMNQSNKGKKKVQSSWLKFFPRSLTKWAKMHFRAPKIMQLETDVYRCKNEVNVELKKLRRAVCLILLKSWNVSRTSLILKIMDQFCYLRLFLTIFSLKLFPVVCCNGWKWIETWKIWANLFKFCKTHQKSYYGWMLPCEICLISSS